MNDSDLVHRVRQAIVLDDRRAVEALLAHARCTPELTAAVAAAREYVRLVKAAIEKLDR